MVKSERASQEPPHPFRDPAWYDPQIEHRPCQCPRCRGHGPAADAPPRLMVGRIVLVVLGGVLLPVASVLVNLELKVVALGAPGTVAILLSVAATLANLVLYPRRKVPAQPGAITGRRRWAIVHHPPKSTAVRVLLLVGALFGCLTWGYLALLFLPLAPLSVVAIIFLGLGLCGLCPHLSVTVSVIQAVHAARAVSRRLGRRWALAVALATETDADYLRPTSDRKWQRRTPGADHGDLPPASFNATPEPHEWALIGLGFVILFLVRRRGWSRA